MVGAGLQLMDALASRFDAGFEVEHAPVGGVSIDEHGTPLLPEVLERCRSADAILLGAVGGPKWDTTDPDAPRPEQGLLGLRKGLGLFANLRPVRVVPALASASPLREERARGADVLIVRELTGGIYFGDRGRRNGVAHDTCVYSVEEVERIAELAFGIAGIAGTATAASPRSTRRTSSRPRGCGARPSSASRAATRTCSSSTCWSITQPCS